MPMLTVDYESTLTRGAAIIIRTLNAISLLVQRISISISRKRSRIHNGWERAGCREQRSKRTCLPLSFACPHAEGSQPAAEVSPPAVHRLFVHHMLPKFGVGVAVEGGDEATENGVKHVRPCGRLVAELVETLESLHDTLPIGLGALEGDGRDAANYGHTKIKVSVGM